MSATTEIYTLSLHDALPILEVVFEVENSTNLISAISRGTNLDKTILKVMVIPNTRENELLGQKDKLFREQFTINNWKYLLYSDVEKLKT